MIGGAVTGRHLPTSPSELARMGAKVVAASPDLSRLSEAVSGRLLVAGRDAAIATAGYQIEVLTGRADAADDDAASPSTHRGPRHALVILPFHRPERSCDPS